MGPRDDDVDVDDVVIVKERSGSGCATEVGVEVSMGGRELGRVQ